MNLTKFSVYAILHVDKLKAFYESGGTGGSTEETKWTQGSRIFHDAQKVGQRVPIIFADAATTANLVYYAFLTNVEVTPDDKTHYRFEGLTPIIREFPKSELVKKSNNEPLSDDYQRSYSIVYTPDFMHNS